MNQKRAEEGRELIGEEAKEMHVTRSKTVQKNLTQEKISEDGATTRFLEDDNFIDMDISGIRSAFPSEDEGDQDLEDQEEEPMITDLAPPSKNNNATVAMIETSSK